MKIRFIALVIFALLLITGGYAAIEPNDNNNRGYYNFSNDGLDATTRFSTITATGTPITTTGIDGIGKNFDGTENYDVSSVPFSAYPFTFCTWVKTNTSHASEGGIVAIGNSAANNQYLFIGIHNSKAVLTARNTVPFTATSTTNIDDNNWHNICGVFNSVNDRRLYVDGVNEANSTNSVSSPAGSLNNFAVAQNADNQGDQFYTGSLDEVSVWNKSLTSADIQELYNGGSGFFWNYFTATPQIQTNLSAFYNNVNISISVNTTSNVNMSYSLDGAGFISICNACNQSTVNLNSLSEGVHNISFKSIDGSGTAHKNQTFTIDTINPIINNSLPTEINSYNINLSNFITCSDNNIDYCNISFSPDNKNVSTSNQSYTFNFNGNQTYNITAVDLAGNTNNTTGVILVNPLATFNFQYTNGTAVTNYTLSGVQFNTTANFSFYNDRLNVSESNNLLFSKFGFVDQTISFNLTNTSIINQTLNVSQSVINIEILDKDTGLLVTGENFTLTFIATVGAVTSTTNGTVSLRNTLFQREQYQLVVTSANYETENLFFNFNNKEQLNLTVSVINSTDVNLGFVTVKVVDKFGQPISSIVTQSLQWDSSISDYVNVGEALTDDAGNAEHNIILDIKQYIFRAIQGINTFDSVPQIITTAQNGKQIVITITEGKTTEDFVDENLVFSINETFNNNTRISNISFSFTNTDGTNVDARIKYYRIFSNRTQVLIDEEQLVSSSGLIEASKLINSSFDIIAKVGFQESGGFNIKETFVYYGDVSASEILKQLNFDPWVLPLLYALTILLAFTSIPIAGVGIIIVSGMGLFLVPDIMTKAIVAFMLLVGIGLIYVGDKRR